MLVATKTFLFLPARLRARERKSRGVISNERKQPRGKPVA
jgi:hypothetical protein